jgi:hypothetical protein
MYEMMLHLRMTQRFPRAIYGDQTGSWRRFPSFIGGRSDPSSHGHSTASPDKSLVVAAVEKVPAPKNKKAKHAHAVKRQHGFRAGNARIAVLPAATGAGVSAFLMGKCRAGFASPDRRVRRLGRDAALDEHLKHTPVVQDDGTKCWRVLADHPHPVQQHQSLAHLHPSRRQRQAPAALSAGMVLSVQSTQLARRIGRLPHPPRRRMRHHHLRPAYRRHPARSSPAHPALFHASYATCVSKIGKSFALKVGLSLQSEQNGR